MNDQAIEDPPIDAEEATRYGQGIVALFGEQKCAHCDAPATCFGSYEGSLFAYACDTCCAHGCEDGSCVPVAGPRVCQFGEYCSLHSFCHGGEAEELREKIQELYENPDEQNNIPAYALGLVLEKVDARDSTAILEITGLDSEATTEFLAKKATAARGLEHRRKAIIEAAIEIPEGGDGCLFCKFGNDPGDPAHYVHQDCLLVQQKFIDEYGKRL